MSRHYVITISRQFGTGGREIGKALGAALGVPVYDRELLEEAARTYCIPVSVMERNDETAPSRVLESFALSAPSLSMLTGAVDYSTIVTSDTTFAWQSATIRRLAKEGPCVIIGRCADHVLRGTRVWSRCSFMPITRPAWTTSPRNTSSPAGTPPFLSTKQKKSVPATTSATQGRNSPAWKITTSA